MISGLIHTDAITAGAGVLASSYTGWLEDAKRGVYPLTKRLIDMLGAALGLLLLSPLLLIVAVIVRLESPGPVFFSQVRVGRRGRPFRCRKFRSMYVDAEARKDALMAQNEMQGGTTFKMKLDPRITRVGRFIRKASIDELPQLFNVLMGQMSLVGPRPEVPKYVEMFRDDYSARPASGRWFRRCSEAGACIHGCA